MKLIRVRHLMRKGEEAHAGGMPGREELVVSGLRRGIVRLANENTRVHARHRRTLSEKGPQKEESDNES